MSKQVIKENSILPDAIIMYALIALIETRERQLKERLTIEEVQNKLLGALSGFFFGFMGLQVISQIKTGS